MTFSNTACISPLLAITMLILSVNLSCKKDSSTPANNTGVTIDPTGKWKLESSTSVQNGYTYPALTSTQYPCIANNTIVVNADGTVIVSYEANDTCYIVNTPQQIEILGEKGDYAAGTWTSSQNTFYLTLPSRNVSQKPAQLSLVNSKYQMTFVTTYSSINLTETNVYTK